MVKRETRCRCGTPEGIRLVLLLLAGMLLVIDVVTA